MTLPSMSPFHPRPLTGIAIGDALGMPFETLPPTDEALVKWDGVTALDAPTSEGGYSHGLKAWDYTDDTYMSMASARALILAKGFDQKAAAASYLAWFNHGITAGIGGSIRKGMEALNRGVDPDEAGVEDALGSGAAMRAVPLGVYLCRMPVTEIRKAAYKDANITHRGIEGRESGFAVSLLAATLMASCTRHGYKHSDLSAIMPGDRLRERLRSSVEQYLVESLTKRALQRAFFARDDEDLLAIGSGGNGYEVAATALGCLLLTGNFKEAIVKAIKLGGDTDTRAAVVGGLAGIYRDIPMAWEGKVKDASDLALLDAQLCNNHGLGGVQ